MAIMSVIVVKHPQVVRRIAAARHRARLIVSTGIPAYYGPVVLVPVTVVASLLALDVQPAVRQAQPVHQTVTIQEQEATHVTTPPAPMDAPMARAVVPPLVSPACARITASTSPEPQCVIAQSARMVAVGRMGVQAAVIQQHQRQADSSDDWEVCSTR